MPVAYINRRGDKYYLLQGKTKTGKPKYYASRKPDGVQVDQVPDGYELHEKPENGIVTVRKVQPTSILPAEGVALERWAREFGGVEYVIVDVRGDSLVVYTPANDPAETAARLGEVFGVFGRLALKPEDFAQRAQYTAMFRFTLGDEKVRHFSVERWCFRGSIDDWFYLAGGQSLEKLAKEYLPHLNKQSFFELM